MFALIKRGVRAIQRDGAARVFFCALQRARRYLERVFKNKILIQANRVSPYFYSSLYRKIYGYDREIRNIVRNQSNILNSKSQSSSRKLFIDCGVNEGVILSRYRKVLPSFDFMGFEIQFDLVERARKVNKGVEIRHCAVSDVNGDVRIVISRKSAVNVRGGTSIVQSSDGEASGHADNVSAIRFSELLSEKRQDGYDFIVVKMDIEGAEYQIIKDLYRAWKVNGVRLIDYLMIEFHPLTLVGSDDNARYEEMLEDMDIAYSTWI